MKFRIFESSNYKIFHLQKEYKCHASFRLGWHYYSLNCLACRCSGHFYQWTFSEEEKTFSFIAHQWFSPWSGWFFSTLPLSCLLVWIVNRKEGWGPIGKTQYKNPIWKTRYKKRRARPNIRTICSQQLLLNSSERWPPGPDNWHWIWNLVFRW